MGDRYNNFRYGEQKYGASNSQNLLWAVEIDWDADGVFDGQNEAPYVTAFDCTRGRQYYINADGDGFEPMSVGRCNLTFENSSRRFDPWNTQGPLYGLICPGRKAQISVSYLGVRYPVMAGYVSDIQPASGDYSQAQVTILDGMQYLVENTVSVLLQKNISYATGIGLALDAISWPDVWGCSLDTGIAELPYWWCDGDDGRKAIQALADGNLGIFFVAADGKAKFYSRDHVSDPVMLMEQADINKEIILAQPWEVVRNTIHITAHPLTVQTLGDLWKLGDKPSLGIGETITLFANFAYNSNSCAASGVIAPLATTDYLANSASDGSGTNLTASIAITTTVFSKTAKLEIKNNSGSLAYITMLRIRGNAITDAGGVTLEEVDMASQDAFGKRAFSLDTPWLQNTNNADSFAKMIKTSMAIPRAFPQIYTEGRPDIQFMLDLFDAVTLDLPDLEINDDYRVGWINHKWLSENGQMVRTTLKTETYQNINANAWQFPTRIGQSSIFAY
jgi:hypothetical protein